jgi:hypothetical protein
MTRATSKKGKAKAGDKQSTGDGKLPETLGELVRTHEAKGNTQKRLEKDIVKEIEMVMEAEAESAQPEAGSGKLGDGDKDDDDDDDDDDSVISAHTSDVDESEQQVSLKAKAQKEWDLYVKVALKSNKAWKSAKKAAKQNKKEPPKQLAPCEWWREMEKQHPLPHVAALAKKYFSVQATSAPSERVFSTAGIILNPKRRKLLPQTVNRLVLLHDNQKYWTEIHEKRGQTETSNL